MITLPLSDIQEAVAAAFDHYLDQRPHSFTKVLSGYAVEIDISLNGDRFNCGIPGYNMDSVHEDELRAWVPSNVRKNSNQGQLAPRRDDAVNVWLKGGVYVMFNFHVNLANG